MNLNLNELIEKLEDFVKEKYPEHSEDVHYMRKIYKILVESLRKGEEGCYYSDLAEDIGLISSRDEFEIDKQNKLKEMLAIISEFEVKNGRPMLSAIVVRHDNKRPGKGFFEWAKKLRVLKDEDEEKFWIDSVNKLRKTWKN